MKILIISDSHVNNNIVMRVLAAEKPDMLIHLGDIENDTHQIEQALGTEKPSIYIRGNCDYYDRELKPQAVFSLLGHRFFATHGHMYSVDYGYDRLVYAAKEKNCDIALFGHIHRPVDEEIGGVRVLNPGSISRPRGGSERSYIIMELEEDGKMSVEFHAVK